MTVSSSGRITEFNRESGIGVIEEEITHRLLTFRRASVKKNATRYLREDGNYAGELFDFDIAVPDSLNNNDTNTSEAIHVRHRVLMCTLSGVPY